MVAFADNLAEKAGIKTRRKFAESVQSRPVAAWKRLSRCRMIRLIGIAPCPIGIAASLPQTRYFESSGIGIAASLPQSVDGWVSLPAAASIDGAFDCDPYGNTLLFTAPGPDGRRLTDDDVQSSYGANEIIYCGYRFDAETQLYYVRNRTYNPVLGRWIQRDPIGYMGGNNLYGYADSNSPVNLEANGLCGFVTLSRELLSTRRREIGPISFRLYLSVRGKYEKCNICCGTGSKGVKAEGTVAVRGQFELWYLFGPTLQWNWGPVHVDVEVGVRVYGGLRAEGKLGLQFNSCTGKINATGDAYIGGFLGVEGGASATAALNGFFGLTETWKSQLWVGGRDMVQWHPRITCDNAVCRIAGPLTNQFRGYIRGKVGPWSLTVGVEGNPPFGYISLIEPVDLVDLFQ